MGICVASCEFLIFLDISTTVYMLSLLTEEKMKANLMLSALAFRCGAI